MSERKSDTLIARDNSLSAEIFAAAGICSAAVSAVRYAENEKIDHAHVANTLQRAVAMLELAYAKLDDEVMREVP